MRYAQLEIDSGNIVQARSIFERALAIDYTYIPLWYRYAQMEARARQFVNAAAVLERGCSLLPYESKLWLQFLEFEEIRGDYDKCRSIFERWAATGVEEAWNLWLHFEIRINEQPGRLQKLSRDWIASHPSNVDAWLSLASYSPSDQLRQVHLEAINSGSLTSEQLEQLESKFSSRGLGSNKLKDRGKTATESSLSSNSGDIELWWATLNASPNNQRELIRAAMSHCSLPTTDYKTLECRKFALLWLRFAIAAEQGVLDIPVREVYELALGKWSHSNFTSATLWRNYAFYFIRSGYIDLGRKVFGSALQKTRTNYEGNQHILRNYIDLEKKLLETERVRRLFCIMCSNWPRDPASWIQFVRFEVGLGELGRSQKLFSVAIGYMEENNDVDALWKECADIVSEHDIDEGRKFWGRALLESRDRVDLYAHYAMFELGLGLETDNGEPDAAALHRARNIFEDALTSSLIDDEMDTAEVYDYFLQLEETYGKAESVDAIRLRRSLFENAAKASGNESTASESDETNEPNESTNRLSSSNVSSCDKEQAVSASAIQKLMANAQKWKNTQS